MKHYLSPTGTLHAYELDGSQDEYIPDDFVLATPEQVQAIQNPAPAIQTIAQQLAALDAENTLTQRNLREFILLTAAAVKSINPAVDLALLPGVAKVAEVEAAAFMLRAQL